MKNSTFLKVCMLLVATYAFVACDKEKGTEDIIVHNGSSQTQTVFADEELGDSGVNFTTTGAWVSSISAVTPGVKSAQLRATSENAPEWISISPDEGKAAGNYSITISLTPNTTGTDRTAVITISCGDTDITITVIQKATKEDGTIPDNTPTGWVKKINGKQVIYEHYDSSLGVPLVEKFGEDSYVNKFDSGSSWSYVSMSGNNGWQCHYEYDRINMEISGTSFSYNSSTSGVMFTTECKWDGSSLFHIRGDQKGVEREGFLHTEFEYSNTTYYLGNIDINWLLSASEYFTALPVSAIGVRTSGEWYLLDKKTQTEYSSNEGKYDGTITYRYVFNEDEYVSEIYETSTLNGGVESLIYTFEY